MGLLEYLDKLVTEHGSAAVLDKHLAFVREQAGVLTRQVEALQRENTTLNERLRQCNEQLASKTAADDFVEHRGALFKRKPGGGYHQAVYCPVCRTPAGSHHTLPYDCRCGWSADFSKFDLDRILTELR